MFHSSILNNRKRSWEIQQILKNDINEDQCEDVESERKSDTETSNGVNITLKNGTTIKQRKSFRVIRYARFNKKTNNAEICYRERLDR